MTDSKNQKPVELKRVPDLSPFIGRRIKNLRCSIGVNIAGNVTTSLDTDKHGVEMTQGPMAVLVKKGEFEAFIYIGNLIEAKLYPQDV